MPTNDPALLPDRGVVLGSVIADLRRARGMTQSDLAAAARVGLETLRKLEQGRVAHPGVFRVADLAEALDASVDQLLAHTTTSTVVSMGYEGRDIDSFITSVTDARVDVIADVRLTPVSRKKGFSKTRLQEALADVAVDYIHLRALGNAKENRPLFAGAELEVGRARYRAGLRSEVARADLGRLALLARTQRLALLCFERDEARCHRRVILEELAQPG